MEALIGLSLFGAAGWWWLLRRTVRAGAWRAPAGEWRLGDDIFAALMTAYFLLGILGGGGERTLKPEDIRSAAIFCAVSSLFVIMVTAARGRSVVAAFGLRPAFPARVLALGAGCLILAYPIMELAVRIVSELGGAASENDELVRYLQGDPPGADVAWAVALAVVAAPLFEELVFRGFLYGVLRRHVGRMWSALTNALLFAAVHQNLPAMPAYFLLGLAFVLAYEISGSLWAPFVMHVLFNSVSAVVILWFPQWVS